MSNELFSFENLDVYKKAMSFVDEVYNITKEFPKKEMFGLTSQLRRAGVSIALNISEGSARKKGDFARFIDMARGSIFECVAIVKISLNQGYIDKKVFNKMKEDLTELSKMLSGLKKSITRREL